MPTGARFVDTMRTITSEELSIFIPFNVQEIHDDLGYCYGFNKVSKNLIIGNRKLLKNGNGMVFGVPGSGKSYNEKSEMGQVLCFSKDDIIVVDPMGEYKDIAAAWGGQYINLTQSAENFFMSIRSMYRMLCRTLTALWRKKLSLLMRSVSRH